MTHNTLRDILTEREFEVAVLVHAGLSNPEIGAQLGIADNTIKKFMSSIFDKAGIDNRVMLAVRLEREKR